jgi:hypothetical protein
MAKKIWLLCIAVLVSCTTAEKVPSPEPSPRPPESLNLSEIKSRLKMSRERDKLGFLEKRFNRCDFKSPPCSDDFLVTIHFRLLCRESQGTVDAISAADLIPIQSNSVSWKLGTTNGYTRTDQDGYGQVEVVRSRSATRDRLRLTIEERFVATPAIETERIVVPENWCKR